MLSSLLKLAFNVVNFVFLDKSREVSLPGTSEVALTSTVVSSVLASRLILVMSFTPMVSLVRLVSLLKSTAVRLFWCRSSSVSVVALLRSIEEIPPVTALSTILVKAWK